MTPNNFRVKNGLTVGNNANITGYVNASSYVDATSFNIGATVVANTTGVYATHLNGAAASGYALLTGALFTGTVNAASVSVGTSFIANTTRVVVGTSTGLQANGGIGTAGQTLHSNGTTVYWAADDGITSLVAANGLNGGTITSTGTISVLGGSTLTVNTTGVHVNSTLSLTDLTLSGNLTVSGTRTYVNTTTLDVGDNIITLNADLGASAPSQDAGIEIMRGTSANVQFMWDETNDRWSTNGQPLAVSSLIAAGAASGITTLGAGNTTITGFANVTTTLQVGTNTASFGNTAYIVANGNFGLGTSSPGSKLTVVDGYTDLAGLRIAGTAMDSFNNIYLASGDLSLSTGGGAITFKPGLTERMRIDSSGSVYAANIAMANNNITRPVLTGYTEHEVANAAVTGTFTMDCGAANFFDLTLTGNTTISPSNVPPSTRVWSGSIAAKQDATGGRTITWPTGTKYAGGVAPPATTTANALDIWSLMTYDGGTSWIVSLSVKGVA